ncbi:hypothetical protein [Bdellovibrio svalbardensis]|uniref:Uncharacterized protein n=1 Tax=Bdellovibrio svalbardensis TaxID=2972972 RepID=A0ABT6DL60_9BACT|nr:hypothetical protein [Bdellovibrio svalbardensis]MDG0817615.1 hypothetical protein [Bdellovibrio svalbardensis]
MMKLRFFFSLTSLLVTQQVFAMDLPFDNMNGFPSNKIKIDYSGWTEPVEPMNFNRAGVQIPLYFSETDTLRMSVKGSHLSVPKGVHIPGSDLIEVPESLSSLEAGLQYTKKLEGEKTLGAGFSYGSASDSLFASKDSIAVSANVFYSLPSEKNDRWIWALFYSNNSPVFRGPVPSVAYFFKRDKIMGAVGIPFVFLRWTPSEEPWAFTFFDLGTIVKTELSYGPPVAQAMVGFDWNQQTWLRYDVKNSDNKLYFDEKKVFVGTRFLLAKLVFTELQVGQAFDRSFYEGQGLGRKETGTAYIPSSWFAAWSAKIQF